jgi:tetrahydrodipicolinate N-succinyltransferase
MSCFKKTRQALKKEEQTQRQIAEKYLHGVLDKICKATDIQLSEWEINQELLKAILANPKIKNKDTLAICAQYDLGYKLIHRLNIRTVPKYKWFTSIKQLI